MATARRKSGHKSRAKRSAGNDGVLAWTVTLLGGVALIVAGFSSGVLLGVMTEEPQIVTGHLAGRSETVPWTIAAADRAPTPEATAPAAETVVAKTPPAAEEAPVPPAPVAAKPKPRAALPEVAAPPPSGFAIQVGAFSTSEAARAMISKLAAKGYKSYVAAGAAARDGRWRVRIGPFATREAADAKAAVIKREQKLPTWVLSEEG